MYIQTSKYCTSTKFYRNQLNDMAAHKNRLNIQILAVNKEVPMKIRL